MKYLVLVLVFLTGLMISASSYRVYLMGQSSHSLINSIFHVFPITVEGEPENLERDSQYDNAESLCNSIFTGMSYSEVSAIIGWEGILLYENEIDSAAGKIKEKVYQWNNQDINNARYPSKVNGEPSLYWNLTLRFQNDILVNKSCVNFKH